MEAAESDDETMRLQKLASKISRYMEKDRDDKLRTVLEIIRDSKHSLAALDSSGVGKLVKKLSKQENSIGRVANKLIKKWKRQAERNENDAVHAGAHEVQSESEFVVDRNSADIDRSESQKALHAPANGVPKALTQDKLAEAERMDPAYAAILQKLYANSSAIPDSDDVADSAKSHVHGQSHSRNQQQSHGENGMPHQRLLPTTATNRSSFSSSGRHSNVAVSRRAAPVPADVLDADAQFEIKRASGHSQIYSGSRRHNGANSFIAAASHGHRKPRLQREIPSLQTMCLQLMKENINLIDDLGGPSVAYHIIKPVLEACDVQQLARIEEANPHLYVDGDTNELWKRHVQKDFPKADVPEEFVHKRRKRRRTDSFSNTSDEEHSDGDDDDAETYTAWRDVYAHQTAERERNFQRITARIQQNKRERDDPVKRTITAAIVGSDIRAPREVRRAQLANVNAAAEPTVFRGGATALARQIVAASSNGGGEATSAASSAAAQDTVVKISAVGGPRNQQKKQQLAKRSFAPLMARSLKMLKR